jgi:biopolymer transport protein ExbB/TolQ
MVELLLKGALLGDKWVLWILALTSLWSLSVIYERWRVFKAELDDTGLRAGLEGPLKTGDLAGALAAAKAVPSLQGRVMSAMLERHAQGSAAAEEALQSSLIQERLTLEKRLIILGTLGNNAPFVGLFGTVLGVIKAFNDLAANGTSGAAVVMAGISTALVATALGILVAIPAVIAYNYFLTRVKETQAEIESLGHLVLSAMKRA